jgi:RNA polymerase sigma factor (sigma-70 family)
MLSDPLGMALRRLLHRVSVAPSAGVSDAELLERFVHCRDQAAIETLLWRHGPIVLTTCRRMLGHHADSEDCFQATFLVLCRRASTIAKRQCLGSWLYKVAYRVCLRVRAARLRQPVWSPETAEQVATETESDIERRELRFILDKELNRLPERYRAPLVLHYLEGKTVEQTAQELGWPQGTVSSRLARGKELLRVRLVGRGLTLSAATATAALASATVTAGVPLPLARTTLQSLLTGAASQPVASLAQEFLRAQLHNRLKWAVALLLAVGTAAGGMGAILTRHRPDNPDLAGVSNPAPSVVAGPLRDAHGDPLPAGALRRLGTVRFRHGVGLSAVAYAPDGKTIASASDDGRIRLWEAATGKPKGSLRQPGRSGICVLAFAPDGRTLLSGGFDLDQVPGSTFFLWDMAAGKLARALPAPGPVVNCAFSPDGRWFATADSEHAVLVWDAASCQRKWQLEVAHRVSAVGPPLGLGVALAFSPDGKTLATGGSDGVVSLWDLRDGVRRPRPTPHTPYNSVNGVQLPFSLAVNGEVRALAYSPNGATLAVGDGADNVGLWGMERMKQIAILPGSADKSRGRDIAMLGRQFPTPVNTSKVGIYGVTFSPDGRTLASTCARGTILLTDIATGRQRSPLLPKIPSSCFPWREACFSSDGKTLAAGIPTGEVLLWDVSTGERRYPNSVPPMGSCWVAVSPDGNTIAVASRQSSVALWDARTGRFLGFIANHEECCWTAFSPDGMQVLTGNASDHCVRFWDRSGGKEVQRIVGCEEVVFSPDGATASERMNFRPRAPELEVRRRDGRLLWGVKGDRILAQSVVCAPDGRFVAYTSVANADIGFDKPRGQSGVVIRDAATGEELSFISCNPVCAGIALSPQGEKLAIASWDGIRVWDTRARQWLWRFEDSVTSPKALAFNGFTIHDSDSRGGPMQATRPLAFSPDGRLLAAASTGNRILLWDAATGRVRRTLSGHESRIASLAFTPDGRRLISGSEDTTALIWDVGQLGDSMLVFHP